MRRTSRILVALIAMAVLVLGPAAPAPAVEPHREIDLSRAMNTVDAMGCYAHATGSTGLVYLEFSPGDKEPWEVTAKAGYILDPHESSAAFLVVPTDQTFHVDADGTVNGQKRAPLATVSLNMGLPALPEGDYYWAGDYVRGDLEATIGNINSQAGTVSEEDAQAAVWSVTDGLDISDNPTAEGLVVTEGDGSGDGGTGDGGSGTDGGTGDSGTTDGGTGDGGDQGGGPGYDGSGSGGGRAPARATVPPASTAAAGIAAAALAAGAAAAGGGLSGLGSTAGAAGGGGSGGGGGTGRAPTRGAPGGAAGTAASPQAPYQPAQGGGIAPDGPAGRGAAPSAPPTPPPQQPGAPPPQQPEAAPPGQPQRTRPDFPPPAVDADGTWDPSAAPTETEPPPPPVDDDVDIDRGLYDPDYAGNRATPDPKVGVGVDPDSYDPWAAERNAGREAPASVGPAPKEGSDPDITISPESGDYGVDFGGRGVRISKNRNGWNVGVGDRGVGPMDEAGVPDFDAAADGFSVSNRGGTATIGIGDPRGDSVTIVLDKGEGPKTVTIGDQDDRTIITQVRDRYGVGRQFGPGHDPSRTIGGEYDTETGDFTAGQWDRRGAVVVAKEDDTVGVGWSSARGKAGPDDDFTRQISVDTSTGDFGVDWGKVSVSRDDDVFSVGSGERGVSWDTDTDSGILTFGPSDGSRQTTVGAGDGSWMASTRIPAGKIDIDVMVNQGMRWTANEDMAPELLTGGSEEYWVGIKHNWATIRTGRIDGDTQTWFTINRPLW